jgi:demethylmenaquinone methyltransferase/2-methoxy-6-polyprenyl-1,4-benzoquinol methylase
LIILGRGDVIINEETRSLQAKYNITAWFYDILDYPWERQYRRWRPVLLKDVRGRVLEAGVGTGRNLRFYHPSVKLTAIDLSMAMLKKAMKRAKSAACELDLFQEDATVMESLPSNHFDWLISTFLCCVMPDELQPLAVRQFERVLKPGGEFCLLEMQYPSNPGLKKLFELFSPFVEKVYGSRFDRNTLELIQKSSKLKINQTYFLKWDVYLVIEGERVE